ncbi:MAG: serine/threonine protein kinase, partial [Burkholderiales bacterium]|nr:serine/threonine protein kinase [Burkholderiales bacterium]
MINTTLGRYRIIGELGRGAMGTVYRAHDPLIDREVAIKTLHPNLPADAIADVRERFLREAKSAGRLSHPNIVTIFDVGEQGGIAYMAMELLEGQTLAQLLAESVRLPFQTIADLAAQIAEALDRAQQLGIVHRDVKPANIVVSESGHAKLTDFGVAYLPASTMTQTGTMIGSPRYMSPEQVLGLPIDPRSDIFSLGGVLYEMLALRAPFVRSGDATIFPLINRIAAE